MRPEETLCEGQVNEWSLIGQLTFEVCRRLLWAAVAQATGDGDKTEYMQLTINDACGEHFCALVAELRQTQEKRARRAA